MISTDQWIILYLWRGGPWVPPFIHFIFFQFFFHRVNSKDFFFTSGAFWSAWIFSFSFSLGPFPWLYFRAKLFSIVLSFSKNAHALCSTNNGIPLTRTSADLEVLASLAIVMLRDLYMSSIWRRYLWLNSSKYL